MHGDHGEGELSADDLLAGVGDAIPPVDDERAGSPSGIALTSSVKAGTSPLVDQVTCGIGRYPSSRNVRGIDVVPRDQASVGAIAELDEGHNGATEAGGLDQAVFVDETLFCVSSATPTTVQ